MGAYKIAGRQTDHTSSWLHGKVGRIEKKRVYVSKEDFDKYSPETIKRWVHCKYQVEVYEMIDGKWVEIKRYEVL